jgi:PIN domain nuclease of toxin-antitoxin system
MRLLLDTHIFLWFVFDDPKLSPTIRGLIIDPSNEILLSIASLWEVTIKVSTGKLQLKSDVVSFFDVECQRNDIGILPIEAEHLGPLETMPFHHRDPFDRLLIAQSLVENIPILSADVAFDAYEGVTRLW